MATITSLYDLGLRCSSSHGPSGCELDTDSRMHSLGMRALLTHRPGGYGSGHLLLTIMGIESQSHRSALEAASVWVEKTMAAEAPCMIALLEVSSKLPAGLDENQQTVLQWAGETCPVKLSLEGSVLMRLHGL